MMMMSKEEKKRLPHIFLTSYEIAMRDKAYLRQFKFKYLVVDEAHRLKNFNCKLVKNLKELESENRLLLTGTPLQNNLTELWSLLNFLLPDIFDDLESFQNWFDFTDINNDNNSSNSSNQKMKAGKKLQGTGVATATRTSNSTNVGGKSVEYDYIAREKENLVEKLHGILRPFLLRRLKQDVEHCLPQKLEYIFYTKMTPYQLDFYRAIEKKEFAPLFQKYGSSTKDQKSLISKSFNNVLMQLRKVCNHPFLISSPYSSEQQQEQDNPSINHENEPKHHQLRVCSPQQQIIILPDEDEGKEPQKNNTVLIDDDSGEERSYCFSSSPTPSIESSERKESEVFGKQLSGKNGLNEEEEEEEEVEVEADGIGSKKNREYEEQLVAQCGKFHLLERILTILQEENENELIQAVDVQGHLDHDDDDGNNRHPQARINPTNINNRPVIKHKVLIFSLMTKMLDLLEDYMQLKGHKYCRLDGQSQQHERMQAIKTFSEDKDVFCFLLSTRAGGLGLNLTSADTVIIYDSDFNPQMDLQAQDRAHRIGQLNEVRVIRLITTQSVEKRILDIASKKLNLERMIIANGNFHGLLTTKTTTTTTASNGNYGELSKKSTVATGNTKGSMLFELFVDRNKTVSPFESQEISDDDMRSILLNRTKMSNNKKLPLESGMGFEMVKQTEESFNMQ